MLKASCNQENITDFIGATYSPLSKTRWWSFLSLWYICSLRKQLTFGDATTGFPAKWRLRNERRNSILMTRHYSDLGSASHWLNQISHAARPIRSNTQIWVVRHQYGISALVSHLAGKPVVASPIVGCFVRLIDLSVSSAVCRPFQLTLMKNKTVTVHHWKTKKYKIVRLITRAVKQYDIFCYDSMGNL